MDRMILNLIRVSMNCTHFMNFVNLIVVLVKMIGMIMVLVQTNKTYLIPLLFGNRDNLEKQINIRQIVIDVGPKHTILHAALCIRGATRYVKNATDIILRLHIKARKIAELYNLWFS